MRRPRADRGRSARPAGRRTWPVRREQRRADRDRSARLAGAPGRLIEQPARDRLRLCRTLDTGSGATAGLGGCSADALARPRRGEGPARTAASRGSAAPREGTERCSDRARVIRSVEASVPGCGDGAARPVAAPVPGSCIRGRLAPAARRTQLRCTGGTLSAPAGRPRGGRHARCSTRGRRLHPRVIPHAGDRARLAGRVSGRTTPVTELGE